MSKKTTVVPLKFVVQPTAYQVACFYKDPEKIIMSIVTIVEHNNSANTLITKKKNKMKNLDFFSLQSTCIL